MGRSVHEDENYRRLLHQEELARQRLKNYGNGKYVKDGTNDRLNGLPPSSSNYSEEDDLQSYNYGYYVRGSRVLYGQLQGKRPDVKCQIGYKEAANNIPYDCLGFLQDDQAYMSGFAVYYQEQKEEKSKGQRL